MGLHPLRLVGAALVAGAAVLAVVAFVRFSRDREIVTYQGYSGTAIVSADGRVLTIGPYGQRCGATVTAVARESRAQVALFLQYATGPTCGPGEGSMAIVPAQRIRLRASLGHRKLVNGATRTATPSLSAKLILQPRFIPAGFRSRGPMPWMGGDLYARDGQSAACTQTYKALHGPDEFSIVQSSAGLQLPYSGWTPIRVRGLPGRAVRGVITWREQGLTDAILGSLDMTTAQLVAIADSAPGP
jgi:hypothetical protein